jgi:hypothetical protein
MVGPSLGRRLLLFENEEATFSIKQAEIIIRIAGLSEGVADENRRADS